MAPTLAQPRPQEFAQRVEGTWGDFKTRSGQVSYIMTNARLGGGGTDWERRLTARLRPVREVLNVTDMDFDQLLQRDLDDHRVATELVPYLLRGASTGPAFFPPILAVLLPFELSGEASSFPTVELQQHVIQGGLPYAAESYGDAFRMLRLLKEGSEELNDVRFGQLGWNEERAKIVVIDGQHRAMALLAVDRTMNHSWEDHGRGARYRHFYQSRVERALEEFGTDSLGMVQVPVTVCWFPDLTGDGGSPHAAARKLFVDVNREAKAPSADRVVLLSDDDLLNILTRTLLNDLRARDTDPPLYAIAYDNPTSVSGPPTRWSTIVSLQALRHMVQRSVFGPKKYVTKVGLAMRGRESDFERDSFMRDQLRVRQLFRHEISVDGQPMRREELGRYNFPSSDVEPLRAEFQAGWGPGLLHMLGELAPYAAHYAALRQLYDEWQPADPGTVDALAREAVFEGVGMYWTLRDSFEHWRSTTPPGQRKDAPDVVKAWERVRTKGDDFRRLRAMCYLGSAEGDAVPLTEEVFSVLGTQACQVGFSLLLATLAAQAGVLGPGIPILAEALTNALNSALSSSSQAGANRRICLSQHVDNTLNLIGDMNTPRAVEFRYFWLELLCLEEPLATFVADVQEVDPEVILVLRDTARARYTQQLIDERISERRRYDRSRSREDLLPTVTIEVIGALETALYHWFDVSSGSFRQWVQTTDFTVGDDGEEPSDAEPTE